jgi:Domain of unknown function (DUF4833)
MLSRRAFQVLGPVVVCQLWSPGTLHAAPSRELFTLARSTNANVVKYCVRLGRDGQLDAENPIEAYWLMLAEDGRREELTWAERQLAYGFRVSARSSQGCLLLLSACSGRQLRVHAVAGGYRAELKITQQPARLERIFVRVEQHALLPSVRYLEISGVTDRGQPVTERILPH